MQLTKEQKEYLKRTMANEHQIGRTRHHGVLVFACICILIAGSLPFLLSKDAKLHNAVVSYVSGLQQQPELWHKVTPKAYDYLGGFGMTQGVIHSKTMTEAGNRYPEVEKLPVYEYQNADLLSAKTAVLSEEEQLQRIMEMKDLLGMKEAVKQDEIAPSVENQTMKLSIEEDGLMHLSMKQTLTIDQQNEDEVLASAKQYVELYQLIAQIDDPIYHMSESAAGTYEVVITQASTKLPIYYEGTAQIIFSIQESHPHIYITDQSQLNELGEYPVINVEEARKQLLRGNYYYAFSNTEFEDTDIIGYDLTYPNLNNIRTFLPYRLPVYRFYIQKEEGIYKFDVVAINQDQFRKKK